MAAKKIEWKNVLILSLAAVVLAFAVSYVQNQVLGQQNEQGFVLLMNDTAIADSSQISIDMPSVQGGTILGVRQGAIVTARVPTRNGGYQLYRGPAHVSIISVNGRQYPSVDLRYLAKVGGEAS